MPTDCQQDDETEHHEEAVLTQGIVSIPGHQYNCHHHKTMHSKFILPEKFKWETVIKKVLKSAPDQEMAVKKLRKKVTVVGNIN